MSSTPSSAPARPPLTLTVTGEGRVPLRPDVVSARVGVGVASTGGASAEANRPAAQEVATVLERLAALGGGDPAVQITHLEEPTMSTHDIHGGVRVTARDLARLEATLAAAFAAGADHVHHIGFDLSNADAAWAGAREAAMADARRQAEQHARLTGMQLGAPLTISTSGGTLRHRAIGGMGIGKGTPVPVPRESEGIGLAQRVHVTYEIT